MKFQLLAIFLMAMFAMAISRKHHKIGKFTLSNRVYALSLNIRFFSGGFTDETTFCLLEEESTMDERDAYCKDHCIKKFPEYNSGTCSTDMFWCFCTSI